MEITDVFYHLRQQGYQRFNAGWLTDLAGTSLCELKTDLESEFIVWRSVLENWWFWTLLGSTWIVWESMRIVAERAVESAADEPKPAPSGMSEEMVMDKDGISRYSSTQQNISAEMEQIAWFPNCSNSERLFFTFFSCRNSNLPKLFRLFSEFGHLARGDAVRETMCCRSPKAEIH